MVTELQQQAERVFTYAKTHKKQIGLGVAGFWVLLYGLVFFIPKNVTFNFAGATCVRQLTFLPSIHKAMDERQLGVSFENQAKLGSFPLLSTKTCFSPAAAPQEGSVIVATAPFGSIVARKHFRIHVPDEPKLNVLALKEALPVSKPLELAISKPDKTYDYQLVRGSDMVSCTMETKYLSCDVPKLKLKQGKKYDLRLLRSFKQKDQTALFDAPVQTLRAVEIKKSSLKSGQTVYSKPKTFVFTTDKPLSRAEATLKTDEKKPKDIHVDTTFEGKTITVKLSKQLDRETDYELVLQNVEAVDGSTLMEPKTVRFRMSGGPKVTGINIGPNRVANSAVVTIRFDQKLSTGDNITKFVDLKGGNATITKYSKTVSVALRGLPRCKAFSISVAKGLQSKYGITSKSSWKYNSRTICHTVSTYGTSLRGRSLLSYHFGSSGPTTLYVGAIHGNEPSSSGLMNAWIQELENNPAKIGSRRIVVVPTVNPDGMAANSRTNARGVNLNRNFPTDNWKKDIDDTDGKHKGGGGKEPLSEPEARALARLTQRSSPRLILSFHAVGSLVQGDPGSPSASYAAKYASMVGYSNATGNGDTFDYGITGGFEQWAWSNVGIPSMVIELGSYGYHDINHHRAALWAMLAG